MDRDKVLEIVEDFKERYGKIKNVRFQLVVYEVYNVDTEDEVWEEVNREDMTMEVLG